MGRTTTESVNEVFTRWRAEDEALGTQVDTIRQWMRELDQLGRQHFGETATRLRFLREALIEHFDRESEMIIALSQVYSPNSPEISAVQRHSDHDHKMLLERVDGLIERLEQLDPPFDSWQQAMDEMESLVSVLEQHESSEWDTIEMLLPVGHAPRDDP